MARAMESIEMDQIGRNAVSGGPFGERRGKKWLSFFIFNFFSFSSDIH